MTMIRPGVLRMSVGREERQSKQHYDPQRTFPIIPKRVFVALCERRLNSN